MIVKIDKPQVREVHRLSSAEFEKLRNSMPAIFVTDDTSPLQAGFQLGIQFALDKVRQGVVIEG